MQDLSSADLMAICDDYWHGSEPYDRYVSAQRELWNRGSEIREWCRQLLVHQSYEARETGATLLGQLGKKRLLGEAEDCVVRELGMLTKRPVEEDGKELQAVDAAITALTEIGDRRAISYLRDLLFSADQWLQGDSQWNASEALERLSGVSFMDQADPVEAAKAWLANNPPA